DGSAGAGHNQVPEVEIVQKPDGCRINKDRTRRSRSRRGDRRSTRRSCSRNRQQPGSKQGKCTHWSHRNRGVNLSSQDRLDRQGKNGIYRLAWLKRAWAAMRSSMTDAAIRISSLSKTYAGGK